MKKIRILVPAVYVLIVYSLFAANSALASHAVGHVVPSGGFPNPLTVDTLSKFLKLLVDTIIIIAVPIIVLTIIYAGFLFVTAQGNETKITKARNALIYALLGAALILGANAISLAISNTVKQLHHIDDSPAHMLTLEESPSSLLFMNI